MLLSKMDKYTKTFLRQNRRPNISNKISAAETESRIVKIFCFGRIFRLSVDHCSPSVKIQIIGGKVYIDRTQQCFAFTPQAKFHSHNLKFAKGEGEEIESRLSFIIFSTFNKKILTVGSILRTLPQPITKYSTNSNYWWESLH